MSTHHRINKLTYIPLALFIVIIIFFSFAVIEHHDPRILPSPLLDKPAPSFKLQKLFNEHQLFSEAGLKGSFTLVNFWASWCANCQLEQVILEQLKTHYHLRIVGINYQDERENALKWLSLYGNPFDEVAFDPIGSAAIDFGVYGTPETFLIDKKGVIRAKIVGSLNKLRFQKEFLPIIQGNQRPV